MNTAERVSVRKGGSSDSTRRLRSLCYLNDDLTKEFWETWDIPSFDEAPNDNYVEVTSGMTGLRGLTLLAYNYYGRTDLWWIIATTNGIVHPNKELVEGQVLRVPSKISVYSRIL